MTSNFFNAYSFQSSRFFFPVNSSNINFEEESWKKLEGAVQSIYNHSVAALSLEELYKTCEDVCIKKLSTKLYSNLETTIETHIKTLQHELTGKNMENHSYLVLVSKVWNFHCEHTSWIRSIFLYLDRTYAVPTQNVRSIWELGLWFFRIHVAENPEVSKKLLEALLAEIKAERKKDTINRSLIKNLVRMYTSLGIYQDSFQFYFLAETQNFYAEEGLALANEIDVILLFESLINSKIQNQLSEYLIHVESRLEEESERVRYYLHDETRKPLIQILDDQLISKHLTTLTSKPSGFSSFLENSKFSDLKRMYQLFARVGALQQIEDSCFAYVKSTGSPIINDPEREKTVVQELLSLKDKMAQVIENSFDNNEHFFASLKVTILFLDSCPIYCFFLKKRN